MSAPCFAECLCPFVPGALQACSPGLVAALHGDPVLRADLEAARAELARLRAAPHAKPQGEQCMVEAEASAQRPW